VLNKHGAVLQVLTFKMDTFLPQTAIDYPVLLKKALPPGDYSANVRLSIPGVSGAAAKVVTAHPAFSISRQDVQQVFTSAAPQAAPTSTSSGSSSNPPWILIAGGVIAALLLILLLLRVVRRRRGADAEGLPIVQRSTSAAAADAAPDIGSVVERTEPPPPTAPPLPPEPEPEPVAPEPAPQHRPEFAPAAPEPVPPPQAPAAAPTRRPECDPHHFWEVAYDRGQLGEDGVWRFPHRCRNCGLELLARDVEDATAQADARG